MHTTDTARQRDVVETEALPRAAVGPAALTDRPNTLVSLVPYVLLGTLFGVTLMKAEAVSWYRIQEMFRFQSFHMYGIIASAVVVAALSLAVIGRLRLNDLQGEPIAVPAKRLGRGHGYGIGGMLFGLGWGLTGACPGPLLALLGSGVTVTGVVVLAALAGTWVYAHLRPHLPH